MGETVGWIGLGSIGHRMARQLAEAGYKLVVADAGSTALAPSGAVVAASNGAVGQAAEVVLLSLPDGAASLAVCAELTEAPGRRVRLVVDTSTIGIAAAERAAELLASHGVVYLDAPVSGGIRGADAATLAVIVAGDRGAFDEMRPVLQCMGRHLFHVGTRPGQGQTVKLLNNFLSATAMAATSEAVACGLAQGVPMTTILEVLNASTGRNTATSDKFPNRIATESYDGGFTAALMAKDLRLYREAVHAAGGPERIAALIDALWQALDAAEPGADFTRIYPFLRGGGAA